MTVEELKKRKLNLENQISKLLADFEEESGTLVENIDYERGYYICCGTTKTRFGQQFRFSIGGI